MSTTTTNALTNRTTLEEKIDSLLLQQMITRKDIENLNDDERQYLGKTATDILARLSGAEHNDFLDKIAPIIDADTKNSLWQNNHMMISNAVTNFTRRYGIMPATNKIAELTSLSRQTVAKHLKEYRQHPEFTAVTEQFKYMAHNILAAVYKFASNGDMRAAKLYFDMVGALNKQPAGTVVNAQNNYIQINNTILSQENLKNLTAEQLNQIETIVTNNKPADC